MKKIILLILMLLTVGCTAKYELTIEDKLMKEELSLKSEITDVASKDELYGQYLDEYPIYNDEEFLYYAPTKKLEGVEYYTKTLLETTYGYEATYKAEMDFDDYERSRLLNTTFKNFNIGYDRKEKYYYIIAQDIKLFNYNKSISSLEIKVNLNGYEIVENNANQVVGDVLTWHFYKSDSNDSDRIILKYKKVTQNENNGTINNNNANQNNNEQEEPTTTDYILVAFSFIAFILALAAILVFSKKFRK